MSEKTDAMMRDMLKAHHEWYRQNHETSAEYQARMRAYCRKRWPKLSRSIGGGKKAEVGSDQTRVSADG